VRDADQESCRGAGRLGDFVKVGTRVLFQKVVDVLDDIRPASASVN
jgi:hypothetical protein